MFRLRASSENIRRVAGDVLRRSTCPRIRDRHLDNVLLDASSAKLWDVDWGVCFDAGHRLRVPEKVPFRLTPCVARPLGPEGASRSGVFVESARQLASQLAGDAANRWRNYLLYVVATRDAVALATRGARADQKQGARRRGQTTRCLSVGSQDCGRTGVRSERTL